MLLGAVSPAVAARADCPVVVVRGAAEHRDGRFGNIVVGVEEGEGSGTALQFALPGVDRDQITVEVAEGELDVHGEIREKEHTGAVRRQTRHIGRFDYRTTLPSNSDTEDISADLNNGVLTVKVPRTEKGRAQHIEITG